MGALESDEPLALSEQVLASFVRVVTHARIFARPSALGEAFAFADALLEQSNCRVVRPGPRHWAIYRDLSLRSEARGSLASDAWLAALAIDCGAVVATFDRDFARFPGLLWRHPLDDSAVRENPR